MTLFQFKALPIGSKVRAYVSGAREVGIKDSVNSIEWSDGREIMFYPHRKYEVDTLRYIFIGE